MKTLSVTQILNKKYRILEISDEWREVVGTLSDPFTLLVVGRPKNGKTSFVMQLCRHLATRYKVFYNSLEEGDSKTIQDALIRADMHEVTGNFHIGDGYFFQQLVEKLKKPYSAKIVVIDSLDYMKLTLKQFQDLERMFPRKSFIIICWGDAKTSEFAWPEDYFGRKIKYRVGSVILVKNFIAESRGRYGSTLPFSIWPEKTKDKGQGQLKIFNN